MPPPFQGEGRGGDGVNARKPAIYTKEQILAYSNGNPSEGFGEPYRIFDSDRKIARLPGPPFQFMDRVTGLTGEPWQMVAGARVESQYDVPADAWYFSADRQPLMPFAVDPEPAMGSNGGRGLRGTCGDPLCRDAEERHQAARRPGRVRLQKGGAGGHQNQPA